jgi:hypothetical protein
VLKTNTRKEGTTRTPSLVAAVILVPALPVLSVRAAENVVQVKLEDASVNGSLEGVLVKVDRDTVKAGRVTFSSRMNRKL